jgi:NNP family nitrate/nitrite transporter-like MFS transporter
LTLGTGAFAVCFAIFGSVSAMMPQLRERLQLQPIQISIALAVPVLLGSLGRIPLGILTDRFGGRIVFIGVLIASILPALLMGWVEEYWQLLVCGFFIGIALASFSVGVDFCKRLVSAPVPGDRAGNYERATSANRWRRSAHRSWSCSWGIKPGGSGSLTRRKLLW